MADDGGLSRFQKRMQAIPQAVREAVRPALTKQAEEMARTMRDLAPVDSGKLRASIAVTAPGGTTPPYSQPGGSTTLPETVSAVTVGGTDVRYAHLVEYGHGNGYVKGKSQGTRGGAVPAKPFFWPAVRMHQAKAKAAIKRAIGKAVREKR